MKVHQIMTRKAKTCSPHDTLNQAAQVLWENDVGSLPVVDKSGEVVGMITDRDICMAMYTQGGSLSDHVVSSAMTRSIQACSPDESVASAERTMRRFRVRRLPVLEGRRLVGILSLNDIALSAQKRGRGIKYDEVGKTLSSICEHRTARAAAE